MTILFCTLRSTILSYRTKYTEIQNSHYDDANRLQTRFVEGLRHSFLAQRHFLCNM